MPGEAEGRRDLTFVGADAGPAARPNTNTNGTATEEDALWEEEVLAQLGALQPSARDLPGKLTGQDRSDSGVRRHDEVAGPLAGSATLCPESQSPTETEQDGG
eukprot:gene18919-40507_t